jgi:hypothetical protein
MKTINASNMEESVFICVSCGWTNPSSVDLPATYKTVSLITSPPGEDSFAAVAVPPSPEYPVQATHRFRVRV